MMSDDWELERIRLKKMRELLGAGREEKGVVIAKPVKVTDADFDEMVSKYPVVVVDFWAEWCGPCHAIAPIIEELAEEYAGKVVFMKLNVDENPRTAARFGIMSIPTLMIFVNGKPVDAIVGAVPKPMIEAKLRRYL